jgi:hypothetical protein
MFFNAYQGHMQSLDKIYERLREWNVVTIVVRVFTPFNSTYRRLIDFSKFKSTIVLFLGLPSSTRLMISQRWCGIAPSHDGLEFQQRDDHERHDSIIHICAMTSTVLSLFRDRQHRQQVKEDDLRKTVRVVPHPVSETDFSAIF